MVEKIVGGLKAADVEFFAGVPDSLLKSFCAYVTDTYPLDTLEFTTTS